MTQEAKVTTRQEAVASAFQALKDKSVEQREDFIRFLGEDEGPEAESAVRARLASHDNAQAHARAKASVAKARASEIVKLRPATEFKKRDDLPSDIAQKAARKAASAPPAAVSSPAAAVAPSVLEPALPEAAPAPAPKAEPVSVPAPAVPRGATKIEALTHVPGLVGDTLEWIVSGARRPNRVMALGVALAVIGTLVGRRIIGPTESATHIYAVILAPTGYGKDWPLQCGGRLMEAVGAGELLGPHEFASAPGFLKRLARNPAQVCFIDELGDELSLINNQANNAFVSKIFGELKKCYNAWATIITAEKVATESEKIVWPAPSIVGAATPESFFEALTPRDLESGFANRLLILPFEGFRRPEERATAQRAGEPPKRLVDALKGLRKPVPILDRPILDRPSDGLTDPRENIGWGAGAEDFYLAFSRRMDRLEDTDPRRYELSMRTCENAVRVATIRAIGRGSRTVDCQDIEWGIQLAEQSFEAAVGGVDRYMREYYEFPKFCEKLLEKIAEHGGFRTRRDLERDFRSNKKYGFELDRAIAQLVAEERIKLGFRGGSRGPSAQGYMLIGNDEKIDQEAAS